MGTITNNFYYVEVKKEKAKRYEKVVFQDEDLFECYEFIKKQKRNDNIYRIVHNSSQLKTTPLHGGTK